jgi:hypothetical protein
VTTRKKIIEPLEEVIEQLHNDFNDDAVRIYIIGQDEVPANFIQSDLIHPDVFKKSQFVAAAVSGSTVEGRQYIYLAAGRIDEEKGTMVTDLDPLVMVYDLRSGTAAPSGVTCFHADYEGRTEPLSSQVLKVPINQLKKDIHGERIPFNSAPKRFTNAMHYSAKAYRDTFDERKKIRSKVRRRTK